MIDISKKNGEAIAERITEMTKLADELSQGNDGFWRGYVEQALQYLCGDLSSGVILEYKELKKL